MPRSIEESAPREQSRKDQRIPKGTKPRPGQGQGRGHAGRFDGLTVFDLKMRAKDLGLLGYSDKTRAQLIDMLRHH